MKSKWVERPDKRILYIDLSGLGEDASAVDAELAQTVATIGQAVYTQPVDSVLVLVDLRGTFLSREVNKLIMDRIADTRSYIHKTAVVGLTGLRGIFLDFFARMAGSDTVGFEDPEAAAEWLLK